MPTPKLHKIKDWEYIFYDPLHTTTPDRLISSIQTTVWHHTACCWWLVVWDTLEDRLFSFSDNHRDRIWERLNWYGSYIAYADMIDFDWSIIHTRPRTDYWFHSWDYQKNLVSLWFCYFWNWSSVEPNQKQYDAMARLYQKAKREIWNHVTFQKHSDCRATECPWILFQESKVINNLWSINDPKEIPWIIEAPSDYVPWFYERQFIEEFWSDNDRIIKDIELRVKKAYELEPNRPYKAIREEIFYDAIWLERLDSKKINK